MTVSRVVHVGDGPAWVRERSFSPNEALVTSLPDVSEMGMPFDDWRAWFGATAELLCAKTHPSSLTIFYQSDIKRDGRWVDKGYLVHAAAERAGSELLFHKIVCRAPPGVTTFGRPAYAHLLAFSREMRLEKAQSVPDVLPRLGEMTWARAMGREACDLVCRFLRAFTPIDTIVDPFCGVGTMLAAANQHGFSALGVELSRKRAARAEELIFLEPVPGEPVSSRPSDASNS